MQYVIRLVWDQNKGYTATLQHVYMWVNYGGFIVADLIDGRYKNQKKFTNMETAFDEMRSRM